MAFITDGGLLDFNLASGGSLTVSSLISSTGKVKVTQGNLVLTGANTYSGGTTITSNATLQIGDGTTNGAVGTGAIVDDGSLILNNTNTLTISNNISGAATGKIEQLGAAGTTLLSGNNSSYLGSVTVTAGTLQMGSASVLSATNALTVNGGTFALNGFNETVGDFSGTGGTVSLGANTLTAGGTSSLGYAGIITGTGGFTKAGTGTLTLTGANTYSGATTINASSTLQIGSNDITGSLNPSSQVIDNGTLKRYRQFHQRWYCFYIVPWQ
jgi:autotransporter-associated beta strand protein